MALKLFMLWDMEGVSGLFERDQAWYWADHVPEEVGQHGRDLLMADINSAAAAALGAGVDELIICDTHHGGGNLIRERMLADPRITYLWRSRGEENGKARWLPGLNATVDGFLVPGHHAMAGTPNTFLPHTWTTEWADFSVNGQSIGEMGIEACFAGHWGVPVIMMQGDAVACREAQEQFPGIVTACVKKPVDHDHCTGLDPEAARELTARKVAEAVDALKAGTCTAFQPDLPMTVTITYVDPAGAEAVADRPGVVRVDDRTVEGVVERRADVVKWIMGTGLPDDWED